MISRMITVSCLFALSLLIAGETRAQTTAVRVGNTVILLPAPVGFIEVSTRHKTMKQFALLLTPPQSQFIAFYVSSSDWQRLTQDKKPRLSKYMIVHTQKKLSSKIMRDREFKQLRVAVRQKFGRVLKTAVKQGQQQLNRIDRKLGKDSNVSGLRVGHLRPLGVIHDTRRSISYAIVTKYISKVGKKNLEYLMVGTITFSLVKGKLLKLYVFRYYQEKNDLLWVKTKTRQWADQIQRTNGR